MLDFFAYMEASNFNIIWNNIKLVLKGSIIHDYEKTLKNIVSIFKKSYMLFIEIRSLFVR